MARMAELLLMASLMGMHLVQQLQESRLGRVEAITPKYTQVAVMLSYEEKAPAPLQMLYDKQGIAQQGRLTVNAGTGSINITGNSSRHYGINFVYSTNNVLTGDKYLSLVSAKTSGTAISISGVSSASYGIVFNYNNPKEFIASGGGAISINGTGVSTYGIFIQNVDFLSSSGTITLDGKTTGIRFVGAGEHFGSRAGSSITSSSADVNLIGDVFLYDSLTSGYYHKVKTTGVLSFIPYSSSFTSAFTLPTNVTLDSALGGLIIGKLNNTSDVTVASAQTISGPITVYAGTININGNLTTTATSGHIKVLASDDISIASGITLTTSGLVRGCHFSL
jgi:hypothetical protein